MSDDGDQDHFAGERSRAYVRLAAGLQWKSVRSLRGPLLGEHLGAELLGGSQRLIESCVDDLFCGLVGFGWQPGVALSNFDGSQLSPRRMFEAVRRVLFRAFSALVRF